MNKFIFLPLFLSINITIFPNDSRTMLGSAVEVIDNENTNIAMLEETINITLHKDYYEVDVTFDFFNTGSEENVLLGFPVKTIMQGYPENKEWAVLQSFESFINGKPIPEYILKEESTIKTRRNEPSVYDYITTVKWYLREVTFPANEHTYSRVTYKAPYNNSGFFKHAGYIYGTGKNWKGKIGKMNIYINHGDNILIGVANLAKQKEFNFTWEANGRYKYELNDFEPNIEDEISIGIEQIELYGTYNVFGDWAAGWCWNEYLLYGIEEEIIRLYTRNQLRLFINSFYAFHGYEFKNSFYKNYFNNMKNFSDPKNTKYTINPNFSENNFNEIERQNIDYLLRIERMMP